tara:strand:+ start:416 stop:1015 length:600 start_codon:yes stop_codon:yes gene_type:complete
MGMDVYGNDPKIEKKMSEFPIYSKYEDMPWGDREKDPEWKKLKDKFWNEYNAYEAANVGVYFRNNCWWWRPLWDYCKWVSDHYDLNLIDIDLHDSGHCNDGKGLDANGAIKLAFHLTLSIETDVCKKYAKERQHYLDNLERETCTHCNNNNRGHIKKKDCNLCETIGTREHFSTQYPFNIDNVKSFAEFLEHSGGFSIC